MASRIDRPEAAADVRDVPPPGFPTMKSIVFLCALAAAAPATALAETLASFNGENAAGKEFSLVFEADGHSFVGAHQVGCRSWFKTTATAT